MSLLQLRALFECDGCGCPFAVPLDAARCSEGWSVMDYAVDAVRGGGGQMLDSTSVQADMHLCGSCTRIADGIGDDDDYAPTAEEIAEAVMKSLSDAIGR